MCVKCNYCICFNECHCYNYFKLVKDVAFIRGWLLCFTLLLVKFYAIISLIHWINNSLTSGSAALGPTSFSHPAGSFSKFVRCVNNLQLKCSVKCSLLLYCGSDHFQSFVSCLCTCRCRLLVPDDYECY